MVQVAAGKQRRADPKNKPSGQVKNGIFQLQYQNTRRMAFSSILFRWDPGGSSLQS